MFKIILKQIILGNKVKDRCYKIGGVIEEFATMTKEKCLKTCTTRIVTGCEHRDYFGTKECFIHTKYVMNYDPNLDGDAVHTCIRFKQGK